MASDTKGTPPPSLPFSSSASAVHRSSSNKETLLSYPFVFHCVPHKLLLDTRAKSSLFYSTFIHRQKLLTIEIKDKYLILDDQSRVNVIKKLNSNISILVISQLS